MAEVGAGRAAIHQEKFWGRFPDLSPSEKLNGLAGMGNAMRAIGAMLLMCDPRDLGVALTEDIAEGKAVFEPDLFLYDPYPGGIGQSGPLFEMRGKLVAGAAERFLMALGGEVYTGGKA